MMFAQHTIPLSSNFVSSVTIRPRIVVGRLFCIHLHILLTGTATVESTYRLQRMLMLGRELDGALRMRFVVNSAGRVVWGIGSELLWIRSFLKRLRGRLGARHDGKQDGKLKCSQITVVVQ